MCEVVPIRRHIVVEVLHRFEICLGALNLRVGHEYDAVHSLQDELAAGIVVDLSGHCVEMESRSEAANCAQIDREKIEKQRFFISHGTDDTVIPIEWGRKAAEILYDLSCYFSFREYMSGHGVNQKNYMDLMDFFRK